MWSKRFPNCSADIAQRSFTSHTTLAFLSKQLVHFSFCDWILVVNVQAKRAIISCIVSTFPPQIHHPINRRHHLDKYEIGLIAPLGRRTPGRNILNQEALWWTFLEHRRFAGHSWWDTWMVECQLLKTNSNGKEAYIPSREWDCIWSALNFLNWSLLDTIAWKTF